MEITSYLLGKKAGGGSTPTGTINITENGIKNVSNYATANVNVEPDLESKSITITENTTTIVEPTTGKDGLSSVNITTNVSGSIPKTFAECTNQINETFERFLNYLDTSLVNSRTAYTNNSVVLYTPDIACKFYVIRYRNNKYSVVWFNHLIINGYSGTFYKASITSISAYTETTIGSDKFEIVRQFRVNPTNSSGGTTGYYSNEEFDTIEDTISAMLNNELTYTKSTSIGYSYNDLYHSNMIISIETGPSSGRVYTLKNVDVISHNETIVAME